MVKSFSDPCCTSSERIVAESVGSSWYKQSIFVRPGIHSFTPDRDFTIGRELVYRLSDSIDLNRSMGYDPEQSA